jgi:hypothetical protein
VPRRLHLSRHRRQGERIKSSEKIGFTDRHARGGRTA